MMLPVALRLTIVGAIMPRLPRTVLPGVPLHITQRGVDRCSTFRAPHDFAFYRLLLGERSAEFHCAIHAYVLMTNHVHLLLTPADSTGPARLMQSLNMRYVRFFNDRHRRTGTLWEGRYHSVVVDSSRYLFDCYRYIEMNPVHAGMVADPRAYDWSSHGRNAYGAEDEIVRPHPRYLALAESPATRCAAYGALFDTALDPAAVATFRSARRGFTRQQSEAYEQVLGASREHASDSPLLPPSRQQ